MEWIRSEWYRAERPRAAPAAKVPGLLRIFCISCFTRNPYLEKQGKKSIGLICMRFANVCLVLCAHRHTPTASCFRPQE